jgi:hypothetical protein
VGDGYIWVRGAIDTMNIVAMPDAACCVEDKPASGRCVTPCPALPKFFVERLLAIVRLYPTNFRWGSTSGLRELNRDAEDLPVEPDRQTPDATAPRQYVRRKKSQQWVVE